MLNFEKKVKLKTYASLEIYAIANNHNVQTLMNFCFSIMKITSFICIQK